MKNLIFVILVLTLMIGTAELMAGTDIYSNDDRAVDSPVFIQDKSMDNDEDLSLLDLIPGSESKLVPSRKSFELDQKMKYDSEEEEDAASTSTLSGIPEGGLNPGKAVLMSALIPGAGQVYAGSFLKAAMFMTLEVACWSLAIKYGIEGDDKDKEFKKYADAKWREDIYREYEFWLAENYNTLNPERIEDVYLDGNQETWEHKDWESRLIYLPTWFTHELPEEKTQQYYEMIGKYLLQFGVGWDGEYNYHGDNTWDPNTYYAETSDETREIKYWYGNNIYASTYGDMRYDSNKLLKLRDDFFKVVMVNHVLAALDAGFTSIKFNRGLRAELGAETRFLGDELVTMGSLNFTW